MKETVKVETVVPHLGEIKNITKIPNKNALFMRHSPARHRINEKQKKSNTL